MCFRYQSLSNLQEEKRYNKIARSLTQLLPLDMGLCRQGASPLHEGENAELQRKVNRPRLIAAHHFNDEAEE